MAQENSIQDNATENIEGESHEQPVQQGEQAQQTQTEHEPLTVTYERLRHTDDAALLHDFATRQLPDRKDQSAFSRATALLEAVAGNAHTLLEDRIFLAQAMPFPNILVKLSQDSDWQVRQAVAANSNDKNWLVGRLTKDEREEVRAAALLNPQTSWKMRMEGAEDSSNTAQTLDYLSRFGVDEDMQGPAVLTAMIRRAVALNPSTTQETLERLAQDTDESVRHAVEERMGR